MEDLAGCWRLQRTQLREERNLRLNFEKYCVLVTGITRMIKTTKLTGMTRVATVNGLTVMIRITRMAGMTGITGITRMKRDKRLG